MAELEALRAQKEDADRRAEAAAASEPAPEESTDTPPSANSTENGD